MTEQLSIIIKSADDKKAFDMKVLKITKLTSIADYFVILSGNSERQVMAISDDIDEKMHTNGYELKHKEGYSSGRWVLLDYGDIIVHVFHKEDRNFYNLERLWADAENIDTESFI